MTWVVIGRLGKPFGVKGWLKLHSFTEPAENIFTYSTWHLQQSGIWSPARIEGHKIQGLSLLVKFVGCDTPEQAQGYTNTHIAIERQQLPSLEEGNYYWADLEGLSVINQQGILLGQVMGLLDTGANDVLIVKGDKE